MGFRFRKSVNVGGVRVNFSKSGVGYSVGTKGARITKTANGRTRTTAGIPGTGLSYVSETSSKSSKGSSVAAAPVAAKPSMASGIMCRVFAVPMVLIGLLLGLAVHPACYDFTALGVIYWLIGGSKIKKAKEARKNGEV
jgi:hypothetical protein